MKRNILKVFICICLFSIYSVDAACEYDTQVELNTSAANVKADYEIKTRVIDINGEEHFNIPDEEIYTVDAEYYKEDYVVINVLNVPDNIYFTISNSEENVRKTVHASELTDGVYSYEIPDLTKVREYTITIHSNELSCMGDLLRTMTVYTPKYNTFADTNFCESEKVKNTLYCQRYVTEDLGLTDEQLSGLVDSLKNKDNGDQNGENKNLNLYIVLSVVILILVFGILVVIFKRKGSKK